MKVNSNCIGCGVCIDECPRGAIHLTDGRAVIDNDLCTNCGLCAEVCPVNAIEKEDVSKPTLPNKNPHDFSYNPGYLEKRIGRGMGTGQGMGIGRRGPGCRRKGAGRGKKRGMGRRLGW